MNRNDWQRITNNHNEYHTNNVNLKGIHIPCQKEGVIKGMWGSLQRTAFPDSVCFPEIIQLLLPPTLGMKGLTESTHSSLFSILSKKWNWHRLTRQYSIHRTWKQSRGSFLDSGPQVPDICRLAILGK